MGCWVVLCCAPLACWALCTLAKNNTCTCSQTYSRPWCDAVYVGVYVGVWPGAEDMQWVDTLDFFWDSLPDGDKVGRTGEAGYGFLGGGGMGGYG